MNLNQVVALIVIHRQTVNKVQRKNRQIHVVSQDDLNQYNLQADSADHVSEYCRMFIPEKELKELILCERTSSAQ